MNPLLMLILQSLGGGHADEIKKLLGLGAPDGWGGLGGFDFGGASKSGTANQIGDWLKGQIGGGGQMGGGQMQMQQLFEPIKQTMEQQLAPLKEVGKMFQSSGGAPSPSGGSPFPRPGLGAGAWDGSMLQMGERPWS